MTFSPPDTHTETSFTLSLLLSLFLAAPHSQTTPPPPTVPSLLWALPPPLTCPTRSQLQSLPLRTGERLPLESEMPSAGPAVLRDQLSGCNSAPSDSGFWSNLGGSAGVLRREAGHVRKGQTGLQGFPEWA